jgi:hypothetical protein
MAFNAWRTWTMEDEAGKMIGEVFRASQLWVVALLAVLIGNRLVRLYAGIFTSHWGGDGDDTPSPTQETEAFRGDQ